MAVKGLARLGCARSADALSAEFAADLGPSPDALATLRRAVTSVRRWIKRWNVKTGMTEHMLKRLRRSLADGHPVARGSAGRSRSGTPRGVLVVPETCRRRVDGP